MTTRSSGRRVASISCISVTAKKSLKSIELFVNNQPTSLNWEHISEQTLQVTLDPSRDFFGSSSQLTLNLRYRHHLGSLFLPKRDQYINIDTSELISPGHGGNGRGREWKGIYGGADVTIHFSSEMVAPQAVGPISQRESHSPLGKDSQLQPTTEEIMLICPRFRILVVGNSGVGKSSVINAAFGINKANVSDVNPGVSNINTEIISDDNKQFVLHDSQGFEHGEDSNFEIVKNFIESRSAMPDIKDKVHAIWLCFEIPRAGGRMLETGIERLLKLENQTPIIAVFTKYDLLVSRVKRSMGASATLSIDAKHDADAIIKNTCVEPLKEVTCKEVINATISIMNGFEYTLSHLVQLTFDLVQDKVAMEASVVTAIAQKVNPGVNIEGCIAVGRTRYWNGLAASTNFANKALEKCLDVIHSDMITVWGLDDPHRHLRSKEFKALITILEEDLSENKASDPKKAISIGVSMVGTIAGIVSALSGPAAPIVVPIAGCIAGCILLAKWVHDVYRQS